MLIGVSVVDCLNFGPMPDSAMVETACRNLGFEMSLAGLVESPASLAFHLALLDLTLTLLALTLEKPDFTGAAATRRQSVMVKPHYPIRIAQPVPIALTCWDLWSRAT